MKVFKFGGASVKDAAALQNVCNILNQFKGEPILMVVSAMGKTTNALEKVNEAWFENDNTQARARLNEIYHFHVDMIHQLQLEDAEYQLLKSRLERIMMPLEELIISTPTPRFNEHYDQLVCFGELISTTLVSSYLEIKGISNQWLDARDYVVTDESFRDARIDWPSTEKRIKRINGSQLYVTQGFIGRSKNGLTTTLGREGSDFTASIFAYCLDAESVTIWKDVRGVLNADPRLFEQTVCLHKLSYGEAIELTYLGASVIHPKTVKPLQNKNIPLIVRSFLQLNDEGTCISQLEEEPEYPACIIVKKDQVLLSIQTRDYSFIAENALRDIFGSMSQYGIRAHLTQNSALQFQFCTDNDPYKLDPYLNALSLQFDVKIQPKLELINLRHGNEETLAQFKSGRKLILEQSYSDTVQLLFSLE